MCMKLLKIFLMNLFCKFYRKFGTVFFLLRRYFWQQQRKPWLVDCKHRIRMNIFRSNGGESHRWPGVPAGGRKAVRHELRAAAGHAKQEQQHGSRGRLLYPESRFIFVDNIVLLWWAPSLLTCWQSAKFLHKNAFAHFLFCFANSYLQQRVRVPVYCRFFLT